MSHASRQSRGPDFSYETRLSTTCGGPICGIDEAGRGPLAGPVIASACILEPDQLDPTLLSMITDSKALSDKRREYVLNGLRAHQGKGVWIGIGVSEPPEIDRINILQASLTAMRRAYHDLPRDVYGALIDGNRAPDLTCPMETVVKGDAKCLSIAAASIVAKVTRDRLMIAADQRFPGYGLAGHKGYPTQAHREALQRLGASPIHRRSFAPVANVLKR